MIYTRHSLSTPSLSIVRGLFPDELELDAADHYIFVQGLNCLFAYHMPNTSAPTPAGFKRIDGPHSSFLYPGLEVTSYAKIEG